MGHRVQWLWVQVQAARRNSVQAEAETEDMRGAERAGDVDVRGMRRRVEETSEC